MYVPFSSPHSHSVPFFFSFHFPISAFFCSNRSLSFPVDFFHSFVVFLLCSSSPFLLSLVFSFSISHIEDRFHASRKTPPRGPRLFLPPKKGRVQPGRLYQVSPLSRECRVKTELKKNNTQPSPPFPGGSPVRRGGPLPLPKLIIRKRRNIRSKHPEVVGRFLMSSYLLVHKVKKKKLKQNKTSENC